MFGDKKENIVAETTRVWRDLEINPDYQVSTYGEVINKKNGRTLTQKQNGRSNTQYVLIMNEVTGKYKYCGITHIVAKTFGLCKDTKYIRFGYVDGNPKNNRIDNIIITGNRITQEQLEQLQKYEN